MSAASPFHAAMRAALPGWVPSFLISSVARFFRFDEAAALRQTLLNRGVRGRQLLEALPVMLEAGSGTPDRIPRQGPLVIVANHPFGLLDAFLLDAVLDGVRQDLRFLANHTIRWLPELAGHVIPVNNMNRRGAAMENVAALLRAREWLRDGHALVAFPAGEVATFRLRSLGIVEGEWSEALGSLIQNAGAPVVPVRIEGGNGIAYGCLGALHPLLRVFLLPRETLKKRNSRVRFHVGAPVPPEQLAALPGPRATAAFLRRLTLSLPRESQEKFSPGL